MTTSEQSVKVQTVLKSVPWVAGVALALVWGVLYFVFDKFHGMQKMFDLQFPFFIAAISGVHSESMSLLSGMLFAMLDGALAGTLLGLLCRFVLRRML